MRYLLTRKEAEEATGKSRATISRYVKEGKLSVAKKNGQGHNLFDPSELQRVFGDLTLPAHDTASNETQKDAETHSTSAVMQEKIELEKLKSEKAAYERERQQLIGQIDDLRQRLDSESEERRKTQTQLTVLLTDERKRPRRGFFKRLFGSE